MQLPLGWRNSYGTLGAERTQLQYFQAAHQRPMSVHAVRDVRGQGQVAALRRGKGEVVDVGLRV